jgi:hypothetical protein
VSRTDLKRRPQAAAGRRAHRGPIVKEKKPANQGRITLGAGSETTIPGIVAAARVIQYGGSPRGRSDPVGGSLYLSHNIYAYGLHCSFLSKQYNH